MTKNKKVVKSKSKSARRWLWLAGGAAVLILVAALVWFASANSTSRANVYKSPSDITANVPNTTNAFSVGTLVGTVAPAFTLPDAQGKPYSVQPGDGTKYVFAFNMGYA